MVQNGEFIAILGSVHKAIKAETLLKEQKLPIMLIPAPRSVSSDCGLAIRYSADNSEKILNFLKEYDCNPQQIYIKNGEQFDLVYKGDI